MSHHNSNNGSHASKHSHTKDFSHSTPWKSTQLGATLASPALHTPSNTSSDSAFTSAWQQGWTPSFSSAGRVFNSNQQPVQGFVPASWGWENADFNQAAAWSNANPWNHQQAGTFAEGSTRPTWFAPPTCIAESSKFFSVTCELPGVNEKDIGVIWHEGTLVIRGQKHEFKFDDEFQVFATDQTWGHFQRAIPMSHVAACIDAKKITTTWNNGILEVLLPKVTQTTDSYFKVGSKK